MMKEDRIRKIGVGVTALLTTPIFMQWDGKTVLNWRIMLW